MKVQQRFGHSVSDEMSRPTFSSVQLSMAACCACKKKFDEDEHVPIIGTCGHSACLSCAKQRLLPSNHRIACPLCKKTNAFRDLNRNEQMIEMVRQMNSILGEKEELQRVLDGCAYAVKFLEKCSSCESRVDRWGLRVCIDCCFHADIIGPDASNVKVYDTHELKRSLLCAACCFGENHQGHQTVLYSRVEIHAEATKEYKELRRAYMDKCRTIVDDVTQFMDAMGNMQQPLESLHLTALCLSDTTGVTQLFSGASERIKLLDEVVVDCKQHVEKWMKTIKEVETKLKEDDDLSKRERVARRTVQDSVLEVVVEKSVDDSSKLVRYQVSNISASLYCRLLADSNVPDGCSQPRPPLVFLPPGGRARIEMTLLHERQMNKRSMVFVYYTGLSRAEVAPNNDAAAAEQPKSLTVPVPRATKPV